jgi:hypothetical protein
MKAAQVGASGTKDYAETRPYAKVVNTLFVIFGALSTPANSL